MENYVTVCLLSIALKTDKWVALLLGNICAPNFQLRFSKNVFFVPNFALIFLPFQIVLIFQKAWWSAWLYLWIIVYNSSELRGHECVMTENTPRREGVIRNHTSNMVQDGKDMALTWSQKVDTTQTSAIHNGLASDHTHTSFFKIS